MAKHRARTPKPDPMKLAFTPEFAVLSPNITQPIFEDTLKGALQTVKSMRNGGLKDVTLHVRYVSGWLGVEEEAEEEIDNTEDV